MFAVLFNELAAPPEDIVPMPPFNVKVVILVVGVAWPVMVNGPLPFLVNPPEAVIAVAVAMASVPAPEMVSALAPAFNEVPFTVKVRPEGTVHVCGLPKVRPEENVRFWLAPDMLMPDEPSVRVLPALITTAATGLKMLIPVQVVSAPRAAVVFAAVATVLSHCAMSPLPGATLFVHAVVRFSGPAVLARTTGCAWTLNAPVSESRLAIWNVLLIFMGLLWSYSLIYFRQHFMQSTRTTNFKLISLHLRLDFTSQGEAIKMPRKHRRENDDSLPMNADY